MDRIYQPGSALICASVWDLGEELPKPGRHYIVRRTRADGLVETTVKEAIQDEAGVWWLWPRSTDPKHQSPIALAGREGEKIEIVARVLQAVTIAPY